MKFLVPTQVAVVPHLNLTAIEVVAKLLILVIVRSFIGLIFP